MAESPTNELELWVGSAQWSLAEWRGVYVPHSGDQDLRFYSRWCTAVEGNTTFYAVPCREQVAHWAAQTPERFRFCFKLPRTITHDRRLVNVQAELTDFLDQISAAGDRLGPLWVQLPASFGPKHLPTLRRFLQQRPSGFSWSVELRHPAFEANGPAERQANDLLFAANVDRTIIDSRALFAGPQRTPAEQQAWERKPRLQVRPVALHQHPTVRFIGQTDEASNADFWRPWVDVVARWLRENREPYVFIHTPDNAAAPTLARAFWADVAEAFTTGNESNNLKALPTPKRLIGQDPLF